MAQGVKVVKTVPQRETCLVHYQYLGKYYVERLSKRQLKQHGAYALVRRELRKWVM